MKQLLLAASVLLASTNVRAVNLSEVKTVYVLPMSSGLDQYLAVELTTGAVLQVVTDPQKADVVLTDHLGGSFEQTLADLYTGKNNDKAKGDANPDSAPRAFSQSGMQGQRGRGTTFLVDPKSHDVMWSVYESQRDKTPDGLKRTAGKIASKLSRAIKGK